jgi:chaperonin cofactor prefoldin
MDAVRIRRCEDEVILNRARLAPGGRPAGRRLRRAACALLLAAAACTPVTRSADRYFEVGAFGRASQEYAAVLAAAEAAGAKPLAERDRVLYRLALTHAVRRSPAYDPARARALWVQLIAEHPHSPYALSAQAMLDWLERSERLEGWVVQERRRVEELSAQVERLRDQLEAANAAAVENDALMADLYHQLDAKNQRLQSLAGQLTAGSQRLRELTSELDEIRKLDLAEPP